MDAILLDTTVASLLHPRRKGHPLRTRYETHMAGNVLALSFQSVAELWSWAEERDWGERQKAGMEDFLRKFLVIPYDFELAKAWARVNAQCKKKGRRLEAGDAWIVATAVHRGLMGLDQRYPDRPVSGAHHRKTGFVGGFGGDPLPNPPVPAVPFRTGLIPSLLPPGGSRRRHPRSLPDGG